MSNNLKGIPVRMQKEKPYYILAVRTDGKWGVEFGSYVRSEVLFERTVCTQGGRAYKRKDTMVIPLANSTQWSIDKAIASLNGE